MGKECNVIFLIILIKQVYKSEKKKKMKKIK